MKEFWMANNNHSDKQWYNSQKEKKSYNSDSYVSEYSRELEIVLVSIFERVPTDSLLYYLYL